MNWKNAIFALVGVAVGFLLCTLMKPKEPESNKNFTVCPPPPGANAEQKAKCTDIRDQIEGYKMFMDQTVVKVEADSAWEHIEPIGPPRSTTVNGGFISWDMLEKEMGLLRGFDFTLDDLENMVEYSKANGINDVYAMFAINTDTASINFRKGIGSPILYLDMYFQAVTGDNEPTTFMRGKSLILDGFDDFPKPCPNACPND